MDNISHEELKNKFWILQTEFYKKIQKKGGVQKYVSGIKNLKDAFNADKTVRCIDERTHNGIRSAGSGIAYIITAGIEKGLKGEESIEAGLNEAVRVFNQDPATITGITSHDECGAAGLVFKALTLELQEKYVTSDEFGKFFTKELAKRTGKPYVLHIEINQMSGPSGLHATRFSYFDMTKKFNPKNLEELPQGFVVTGSLDRTQALREAEISANIALGGHGFGELITTKDPFIFVVVANNDPELQIIKAELQKIADKFEEKVKVDGFVA